MSEARHWRAWWRWRSRGKRAATRSSSNPFSAARWRENGRTFGTLWSRAPPTFTRKNSSRTSSVPTRMTWLTHPSLISMTSGAIWPLERSLPRRSRVGLPSLSGHRHDADMELWACFQADEPVFITSAAEALSAGGVSWTPLPSPVRSPAPKTGRNDPCPCGSGKKYKKCCGN